MKDWAVKIYTAKGIAKENVLNGNKALDLGCGQHKLIGAIGMDRVGDSRADVVHDMEDFPWPFSDNEFDLVFSNHSIEHADDVLGVLNEIHRVLKRGGRAVIQVPYFRSVDAITDITHGHYFTSGSLNYVIAESRLSDYQYTSARFKKIGFWYGWPQISRNPLIRIFKLFIHKFPKFYDQYLSILLPVKCLTWEMEAIKK